MQDLECLGGPPRLRGMVPSEEVQDIAVLLHIRGLGDPPVPFVPLSYRQGSGSQRTSHAWAMGSSPCWTLILCLPPARGQRADRGEGVPCLSGEHLEHELLLALKLFLCLLKHWMGALSTHEVRTDSYNASEWDLGGMWVHDQDVDVGRDH